MGVVASSVIVLASLAVILGTLLTVASVVFKVEVDPKVEKIESALPGLNCGVCGFPGCSGYAKAVVKGTTPYIACTPGGSQASAEITAIMEND